MDGEYTVETVVCQAGAEIERWRESNPNPDPGTLTYVRRLRDGED